MMADELVKVLLYFDVFSYPLTRRELICYSGIARERWREVDSVLETLERKGVISLFGGLYYIGGERSKVINRLKGNQRALKRMETARRYSTIISLFPFIRGIFISGSLSKGTAAEEDDIDYFIITRPGRLWLTRTLLTLYKKIFLLNSYKNFCINYFVDTDHLYIHEHNRYTATEVAFLIPVFNNELYNRFIEQNNWIREYYPNFRQRDDFCRDKDPVLKKWIEKIMDNSLGNRLEKYLYEVSRSYIQKKFSYMENNLFSVNFILREHELRYLPDRRQTDIMKKYNNKIISYRRKAGLSADGESLVESRF